MYTISDVEDIIKNESISLEETIQFLWLVDDVTYSEVKQINPKLAKQITRRRSLKKEKKTRGVYPATAVPIEVYATILNRRDKNTALVEKTKKKMLVLAFTEPEIKVDIQKCINVHATRELLYQMSAAWQPKIETKDPHKRAKLVHEVFKELPEEFTIESVVKLAEKYHEKIKRYLDKVLLLNTIIDLIQKPLQNTTHSYQQQNLQENTSREQQENPQIETASPTQDLQEITSSASLQQNIQENNPTQESQERQDTDETYPKIE